jgi:hypothetical protein
MVYSQKNIKKNIFERVFSKDVDSEELIWHRDKKNRIVEILEGDDWLLQMENELPKKLSVGQKIEIHKETYHRIFKGSSDLKIRITEDVDTVRVPKQVIEVVKKGLKYLKKRGASNRLSERIISGEVSIDDVKQIKEFFDKLNSQVTLSESYKGRPHEDVLYLNSLLRGGDVGYKWSIREYYKKRKGT